MSSPPRTRRLAAVLLGVVALVAGASASVYAATTPPDFGLSSSPTSGTVLQAASTSFKITATRKSGFTGTVTFKASNLPSGVTASWSATTVSLSSTRTSAYRTLTLKAASTAPLGAKSFVVTASGKSGSTSRTHSVTVKLTVGPKAAVGVTLAPTSVTIVRGGVATSAVTLKRTSLTSSVTLSAKGLPTGMTAAFTPSSTTGTTSSLKLSTTTSTATGTYDVTVTATAGSVTGSAHLKVTVAASKPFTITGAPAGDLTPYSGAQPLDLSLTNPNPVTITVTALGVMVSGTSAGAACDATNFAVTQFSGTYPLTVGAGKTVRLSTLGIAAAKLPALAMVNKATNQDACKNVTVSLVYSGTAGGN